MILLTIIDGWGIGSTEHRNAIASAKTPFIDWVAENFPGRTLFAHGEYVGLPEGQMGNSEIGHLNIGSGRKIRPDIVVINDLISSGQFFKNRVLLDFVEAIKQNNGRIHVMGLLSDGGIHSHINHLNALLRLLSENGPVTVFLHGFLDGRDTPPKVGDKFVSQVASALESHDNMFFRTVGGRSWGMDRDKNWVRVERHYDAIVRGMASEKASSAIEAVENAFNRGETDEFVAPTIIDLPDGIDGRVLDGDGIVHFNFRADRAIQMTQALTEPDFSGFNVDDRPVIDMVTFTHYYEYQKAMIAFDGEILRDTLTEVVCKSRKKVFKIAETEKWAHVTKFFNGGVMEPFPCEDRYLVQSPLDVRPYYNKKPEMSACEIADYVINIVRKNEHSLIILNFANADMVGHTGDYDAAVKAIETLDTCIKRLYEAVEDMGGTMIITSDHGNAEEMSDDKGEPATKHTINPVPFYILDRHVKLRAGKGALEDIAPTILELMNLQKPSAMTGTSLIELSE